MKKRFLFSAAAAILLLFLCGTRVYAESSWISPPDGFERKRVDNSYIIKYNPPVYNASQWNTCTIEVKDPDGEIVLQKEQKYFASYEHIIHSFSLDKVGTYTITARCGWDDTSSTMENASIEVYDFTDISISGAVVTPENLIYDPSGTPDPAVTVTLNGKRLEQDTDYTITDCGDLNGVGTGEVTVKGIGDYAGEAIGQYKILPLDLTGTARITAEDQFQDYDGETMWPEITVDTDDGWSLEKNRDYEITGYSNNTKPGIATVKIRFIGNYTGTGETTFEVIRLYDLYVGGTQVTNKNAANITGAGISGKVSYDAASNTLNLSNASITECFSINRGYAGTETYAIYGNNLTIRLSGSNSMGYCIKAGALKITGKGSLSLAGKSGLPTSTALTCTSLLVAKDSVFSITKAPSSYGTCAAEIDGKLDVQGTMEATVPSGAPAAGINCGTADISGKLHITVKSAYTNYACGLRGSVTISGDVVIDTSGTKDDAGIRGSSLTVKEGGSLTVLARKAAASVNKLVLGNKLVLLAGSGKTSAFETTPSAEALEEHVYIHISAGKASDSSTEQKTSVPKAGAKLTHPKSGLVYTVTKKGKEVSLKGVPGEKKTVNIPKEVTLGGVKYKVTAIASNTFKGNRNIQEVTIGSKVAKIGEKAFSGCTGLKKVKGGNGVTAIRDRAFYGCSKLTSVTIGSKVTSVGARAFAGCTSLKKAVISSSVKTIGKEAFLNCKKLSDITFKTTKLTSQTVGKNTFKGISSKAVLKVPAKVKKTYKTLLKKKGLPTGAKIKS